MTLNLCDAVMSSFPGLPDLWPLPGLPESGLWPACPIPLELMFFLMKSYYALVISQLTVYTHRTPLLSLLFD